MLYKNKWNLTGTDEQQKIVQEALDKVMFPWDKLSLPGVPEIGWRDLNTMAASIVNNPLPRQHEHDGDEPEPLAGKLNGRKYILGVFYPLSARIYVDNALVDYPELAQSTVSAEIAHSVDEFLPLTDDQRTAIMRLMHSGSEDDHTWWEKVDYGAEYYSLIGESFMQAFTIAYSDMPFGNASDFVHSLRYDQIPELRKIVGIERTDATPPTETPAMPPPPPHNPTKEEFNNVIDKIEERLKNGPTS